MRRGQIKPRPAGSIEADLLGNRRLVVVSNRVVDSAAGEAAGGLAVALRDALKSSDGLWFGWSGDISDYAASERPSVWSSNGIDFATINLTPQENADYYLGHSNECLWPLFHYRADLMRFDRDKYQTYLGVNQRFAVALSKLLRHDDVIWIHDYHLIPLAAELRKLNYTNQIGFFLHIPFPSAPNLMCMPDHDGLLRQLMAYDVVGVQTAADKEALQSCLNPRHTFADGIIPTRPQRPATIINVPVGIDVDEFEAVSKSDPGNTASSAFAGTALIIGADRLDYTKGILERFEAYRRLLDLYPDCRRRVTFLQIAARSRDVILSYDELRQQTDQIAGAIEGDYADIDWNPVCYIRRNVARDQLARLFRQSSVGLVTPLRDGMNLVAKEYVAAQDAADPGVLILSKFAGASEEMSEALIVNPHDSESMAAALYRAVNMPREERIVRHAALLTKIRLSDAAHWRQTFLSALCGPSQQTNFAASTQCNASAPAV